MRERKIASVKQMVSIQWHKLLGIIVPMDPLQEDLCLSSASQLTVHHILHGETRCNSWGIIHHNIYTDSNSAFRNLISIDWHHSQKFTTNGSGSIRKGKPTTHSDRNTVWQSAASVSRQPTPACQIRRPIVPCKLIHAACLHSTSLKG